MTPPMQVPLPPTSKGLLDCSTDVDSKAIARGDLSAERLGGMPRVSENSYAVWVQHLREEGQAMTETPILCPQCDHDNYPAFHAAAAKLRTRGHVVLSPAEHTETADSWAGWMRLGLAMLIQCDAIVLLPGWQESRGAKIEAKLAADLGMSTMEFGAKAPDPDEQRVTRDAGADR